MGVKMTGTIEIEGLRLFARHGVYEHEREEGNRFELSVKLRYPIAEAMATDNLSDTLNYAEAVEIIVREMEVPSQLLEHVTGRIKRALMKAFPLIEGGYIKLTKLTPPIPYEIEGTSVSVEW